jgi:hypothetical protein
MPQMIGCVLDGQITQKSMLRSPEGPSRDRSDRIVPVLEYGLKLAAHDYTPCKDVCRRRDYTDEMQGWLGGWRDGGVRR